MSVRHMLSALLVPRLLYLPALILALGLSCLWMPKGSGVVP